MERLENTITFWQTLLDTSAWSMPPSVVVHINKTISFLNILKDHCQKDEVTLFPH